jgi:hypothetical protein
MHIMRIFHAKRMVLCLGLIGMLAFAGGCSSDPNDTVAPKLPPDPRYSITKETQKAGRAGLLPETAPAKKP